MSDTVATPTQPDHGLVEWDDTTFQPEVRAQYGDDPIRWFRMSFQWPQNPIQSLKFQLGGKERVCILESQVYHAWTHKFSIKWNGSGVNGTRRCTLDSLGRCLACEHYEVAPDKVENGQTKKHGTARCGKRQQTFGANILVYKSDLEGVLLDPQNRPVKLDPEKGPVYDDGAPATLEYEVYLWRFNSSKFQTIREIKKEWGDLRKLDLQFVLEANKQENFQDFSPTVLRTAAWQEAAKTPEVGQQAAANILNYYKENRYDLNNILGKEYTHEDMQKFLFGDNQGAPGDQPANRPAGDIAAEIEKALANVNAGSGVPTSPPPPPQPTASTQPPPPAPSVPTSQPAPPSGSLPPAPADFDALLNS